MAYNVIELRQVMAMNIDSKNRTCVHSADLANGSVVVLEEKNDFASYVAKAPVATSKNVWMIASPEVNRLDKTTGGTLDPRDFVNKAGVPMDAIKLEQDDIIAMTGEGIAGIATNKYLVMGTGTTLVSSATAPTNGSVYLRKLDFADTLKIGNATMGQIIPATVPMYIFEVNV